MSLLNKRLLKDTVSKHAHEVSSSAKQDLQELFKDTLNRIEQGKFKKEESEKVPFLQKMFELLGYKLHDNLEFEYSVQGRSVDGVLGLQTDAGREVEIAIEWKGIGTTSLDKGKAGETPVSQMWDYMGKVGAEIGIVGNFLEFRMYTLKTKQTEYQEYFLRELIEKDEKLNEFIFLFKKQTLLKNDNKQSLLENLISQSEAEQEQITKRFYNDYKQRRLNLFEHLVENNPETIKHILVEKSQKILYRLIFIMFCEDSFLLPQGMIKKVYETARNSFGGDTKIWDQFKGLFLGIDKGNEYQKINAFNGGLFAEDIELNNLIIKDIIWQDLIKLAEYDFESDLNVNILGHIFEQSISDIEELKFRVENDSFNQSKFFIFNELKEKKIDIADLNVKWRFTEEKYNILPKETLNQITFLNSSSYTEINNWFNDSDCLDYYKLKTEKFYNILTNKPAEDEKEFLKSLSFDFEQEVCLINFGNDIACILKWKIFVDHFDDFYYSSSDDVIVFDEQNSSLLFIDHNRNFQFGNLKLDKTVKPKTSKRKKDGIYYTPEYLTDYIVSETIGSWLEDIEDDIKPYYHLISDFLSTKITIDQLEVRYFEMFKAAQNLNSDLFKTLDKFFADLDSYSPPELADKHSSDEKQIIEYAQETINNLIQINESRRLQLFKF